MSALMDERKFYEELKMEGKKIFCPSIEYAEALKNWWETREKECSSYIYTKLVGHPKFGEALLIPKEKLHKLNSFISDNVVIMLTLENEEALAKFVCAF
jgi:hypothetical protein